MKEIFLETFGEKHKVFVKKQVYSNNGATALVAVADDGIPFCTFSVNLPESDSLEENRCYFKNWSENAGFLEQLEKQGIVKRVEGSARTGFCVAPLVEILI